MMNEPRAKKSLRAQLGSAERKTIDLTQAQLIRTERLFSDRDLPWLARPAVDGVDLAAWLSGNRSFVQESLLRYGGMLFRGFGIASPEELERLVCALSGNPLDYVYRSTPRTRVSGNIFTSTEYPAEHPIPMHNEMAYTRTWPLKIWFCCVTPAEAGGETPIADSRRVYERISPEVRERFARLGVRYVRNYGKGFDLSWQNVFQTSDRAEVESFCRQEGIELDWMDEERLRTSQTCQGVARHPVTGESLWFNQAHLFHISALPPGAREALVASFGEGNIPRNAYYGDGTQIEEEVLEEIRACFAAETVVFPWEKGDVLLLDNMKVAHGRMPYSGARRVLAGMAEPWSEAGVGA